MTKLSNKIGMESSYLQEACSHAALDIDIIINEEAEGWPDSVEFVFSMLSTLSLYDFSGVSPDIVVAVSTAFTNVGDIEYSSSNCQQLRDAVVDLLERFSDREKEIPLDDWRYLASFLRELSMVLSRSDDDLAFSW